MAKDKHVESQSDVTRRINRTEAYAEEVRMMFAKAVNDILALHKSVPHLDEGVMYSFDDSTKKIQQEAEETLRHLHSVTTLAIEAGIALEWDRANKECDELVRSCFGKDVAKSKKYAAWMQRNDEARRAFIARTDKNGMNLSKRIWRNVQQLKEEMEVAMTVAIGEGKSAASMSRKVRKYLDDPDLMFRRFRYKIGEDENGNPTYGRKWKKRVIDPVTGKKTWRDYDRDSYKTGQGVYKSAAKNAMRVTRTETNMAYRRADHERWQQMDFVLGIKIELSNQHPVTDICDFVQGDYPKDFVFDGWHPQCFCYATPILISEDEMAKVSEAFARGETYIPNGKPVTETPKGFKKWVKDHKEQIQGAKNPPYWVRNNKAVVNGIWRKKASEEKNTDKDTNNSTTNGKSKAAGQNKDIPHKAVKKVYNTNAELEETFKGINSEFVTDKWFENGDLKISVINKKGKNGETNGKGYIGITAERLDRVKMAMGKIGLGKSSEITFDEADAMATLWHEITHNRNKHGLMRLTDIQRSTMEMMNEFVARKTLPEFYTKLGCSKIPYPEFMENRTSTGYNKRVLGYDFIIQKLGLDPAKVLESAKNNLFNLRYTHQDTTAEQALMDGGLDKFRRVDGKPIGRAQLRKMLTLCRKGTPINKIEEFLRNDGIIK